MKSIIYPDVPGDVPRLYDYKHRPLTDPSEGDAHESEWSKQWWSVLKRNNALLHPWSVYGIDL